MMEEDGQGWPSVPSLPAAAAPENNKNNLVLPTLSDLDQDTHVLFPPQDTITQLAWHDTGEASDLLLAAASWNKEVRIWSIDPHTGESIPKYV
jgi:hypothetical protein